MQLFNNCCVMGGGGGGGDSHTIASTKVHQRIYMYVKPIAEWFGLCVFIFIFFFFIFFIFIFFYISCFLTGEVLEMSS